MPAYVVYRPSVMRSGRLAVRAAAVAALLLAAITAFVLISRAGEKPQQAGQASSVAAGSSAQIAKARLASAHAAKTKAAASGSAAAKAKTKASTAHVAPAHPAKKKKAHAPAIPPPRNTPVAVLNGGTAQGAAAALASRLRALGYPVPVVGNAGRRDLPMAIEYSAGLGPAARVLAKHVGAVQYVTPLEGPNRNLSGARLLVIVGA
jgi:hypothetical protein